jgi:hypothetical protein
MPTAVAPKTKAAMTTTTTGVDARNNHMVCLPVDLGRSRRWRHPSARSSHGRRS